MKMNKGKDVQLALIELIGEQETETFLSKILSLTKSDPVKAKQKIKMAKAFL